MGAMIGHAYAANTQAYVPRGMNDVSMQSDQTLASGHMSSGQGHKQKPMRKNVWFNDGNQSAVKTS